MHILIVEDGLFVAEALADVLIDAGHSIIGPASGVRRALRLIAAGERLDGALLDIDLSGETCAPIAYELRARGVPFVYLTGYDTPGLLPEDLRDAPILQKPFQFARVLERVAEFAKPR